MSLLHDIFQILNQQKKTSGRTPLISILVLTNQKETYLNIQNWLGDNYVIHYASSAAQLSERLVESEVSIIIIDAAFLEIINPEEIIETISFFPELTLIAAVESGETQNLVNLFENFEIYRYLQKPFTADQIKKCISAATRKNQKIKTDTINDDEPESTVESKRNRNFIYVITSVLLLIAIGAVISLRSQDPIKELPILPTTKQETVVNEETENKIDEKTPELLTQDNEPVKTSLKLETPVETENVEIILPPDNTEKNKELLSEINDLFINNEYEQALNLISQTTDIDPETENQIITIKEQIQASIEKNKKLNTLTLLIKERITTGNTITPEKDSAKFYLKELIQYDSDNPQINDLKLKLSDKLISQATQATNNLNFNQTRQLINEAKALKTDEAKIIKLEQELNYATKEYNEAQLKKKKREQAQQLSQLATKAIEENKLIYPEKQNAKYYLQSALAIAPDDEKILGQVKSLVSLMLIQIETDISENTLASASSKINIIKELGIKQEEIALLEDKLNQALERY